MGACRGSGATGNAKGGDVYGRYPEIPESFKERLRGIAEREDYTPDRIREALDSWRTRAAQAEKSLFDVGELQRGDIIGGRKSGIGDSATVAPLEKHGMWNYTTESEKRGRESHRDAFENYRITVRRVERKGGNVKVTALAVDGQGNGTVITRTFKTGDRMQVLNRKRG